MFLRKSKKI